MSGYHDDEEEYEPYEEDEDYDAYEEDELAARGGAVQIAPRAFSLGSDGEDCLLYTSPSPRDVEESRMPSSA